MINIQQIKAARAMLGIGQKELAGKASISVATLNNLERGAQTDPKTSTMHSIKNALESEGVEFVTDPIKGFGLYLKPKPAGNSNEAVILIVDDSKADRSLYKNWLLSDAGKKYKIIEAEDATSGLDVFVENRPDCIILDFMMYGADGFQLLAALKKEDIKLPPIIFVTGMHTVDMESNAKAQGVYIYLNKDKVTEEDMHAAVAKSLRS